MFSEYISDAFKKAWKELITNHNSYDIRHVNESVYRYFIIKHLLNNKCPFSIEDEWHRIDLMLNAGYTQAAIEIKFYDSRPLNLLTGKTIYKGGPGKKNFNEFQKSLDSLINLESEKWYVNEKANIIERYFILIGTNGFWKWYNPQELSSISNAKLTLIENYQNDTKNPYIFGWLCQVKES